MPSKAVVDAVEALLAASWTLCPVVSVNTAATTPADGSPFLVVQYPMAGSEQKTIGSPGAQVWRERGTIRFVLSVPRGGGLSQWSDWADQLAALFRGKQFSSVSTWAPTSPVLNDNNDLGNYWQLSFSVPYYLDIIG